MKHGISAYNRGCRCDECRKANREKRARQRERGSVTARIPDGYYQRNSVFQAALYEATMPERDWIERAACRGDHNTHLFFQDGKHGDGVNPRAREMCAGCEVRSECLSAILDLSGSLDQYGYQGGTTPSQRRTIRRARRNAA